MHALLLLLSAASPALLAGEVSPFSDTRVIWLSPDEVCGKPGARQPTEYARQFVRVTVDQCAWTASVDTTDESEPARFFPNEADVICGVEQALVTGLAVAPSFVAYIEERGFELLEPSDDRKVTIAGQAFRRETASMRPPEVMSPNRQQYTVEAWVAVTRDGMVSFACFGPAADVAKARPAIETVAGSLRIVGAGNAPIVTE